MNNLWKNKATRIWIIVTSIVLVLVIVINVVACAVYSEAISLVLGRARTKIIGEETSLYEKDFENKADAYANGARVSVEICEEGFVLLKNNNSALPLSESETKVSIFGKNSANIATSGSGSAGKVAADVDIYKSLTDAGFTYNQKLVDFYNDNSRSGNGRTANPDDLDSGKVVTLDEGETPLSSYSDDLWASCSAYNDLALIVITRIGGEGFDLPRTSTSHFLQLSANEKSLIEKVGSMNFKKVMLVLNLAASMELGEVQADDNVDAILWTGFDGVSGIAALGEILKGKKSDGTKLSPSGKTVDTWAADFSHNPAWENFGAGLDGDAYTTTIKSVLPGGKEEINQELVYFVDYEEGIYVGYRYYETAYAEHEVGNYDSFIYDNEVVYPFGYGLSYSQFDWELENKSDVGGFVWGSDTSLTFDIKVTNTGNYPARDVVELYVTPPYTEGGIEKSAKVLVGFAKTKVLEPDESCTVSITVDSPYDFASYDYNDANGNNFCGYEVEAGDYIFSISTDSHNAKSADMVVTTSVPSDIKYDIDPVTGTVVENLYTDCEYSSDAELGSVLSRADFVGTWPAHRTAAEKDRTNDLNWINAMKSATSSPNRPELNDVMPTVGKNKGIMLYELAGLEYDDPMWEDFMDQLTLSEITNLINNGAFNTQPIGRLGVPQTYEADGAFGYVNFIGDPTIYGTCIYPCEVVVASTWNIDRVYDFGKAVGNEGLIGNEKGDGSPYSGIYAGGLNIHRTPFGGRNCEYFSEDGFLSGIMGAAFVEGAASKGVYVTMKHFALNDQETHRSVSGLLTWTTEQTMREIYLKSFETAIKTAKSNGVKALGVMSSFNRIGERWTGGDYRLLTTILRNEWGFNGLVISDFNTCSYMVEKDMFYAGGNLDLQIEGIKWTPDAKNASDVTVAREAAKGVLFVVANSNAIRGEFVMLLPVWQICLFVADGIIAAGLIAWGALAIVRAFKKQKQV